MTSLDQLPREHLWQVANQIPLKDLPNFCLVARDFSQLCRDWEYWRQRAESQLNITPWEFEHNGVSRNPAERFYEFWLRRGDCVWGPRFLPPDLCYLRAMRSGDQALIDRYRPSTELSLDMLRILSISEGFDSVEGLIGANQVSEIFQDPSKAYLLFSSPEEWARFGLRASDDPTQREIITNLLAGKLPDLTQSSSFVGLVDLIAAFLPKLCQSVSECLPYVERLREIDAYLTAIGLSYGAGYFSRQDWVDELKRIGLFSPDRVALGNFAAFDNPDFFASILPLVSPGVRDALNNIAFYRSFRQGPNRYFRILAEDYLKLHGPDDYPLNPLNDMIRMKRLDFLRVLNEMGYNLGNLLLPFLQIDSPMRVRLREENLI